MASGDALMSSRAALLSPGAVELRPSNRSAASAQTFAHTPPADKVSLPQAGFIGMVIRHSNAEVHAKLLD